MLFSNVKALVFWFLQISAHCSLRPDPLALLSIFREGSGVGVCTQVMLLVFFFTIGHFSNKGGGGELAPKCVPHLLLGSLMERGIQPLANCSLSLVTVPEVFAKVNSA